MSASRLYCYSPQSDAAAAFIRDMGGLVTRNSPSEISEALQLDGLDHITFIVIDSHPMRIPDSLWEAIIARGALVIHVDDRFERRRGIVPVKHYPGDASHA